MLLYFFLIFQKRCKKMSGSEFFYEGVCTSILMQSLIFGVFNYYCSCTLCLTKWWVWSRWPHVTCWGAWEADWHWVVNRSVGGIHNSVRAYSNSSDRREPKLCFLKAAQRKKNEMWGETKTFFIVFVAEHGLSEILWTWHAIYCVNASRLQSSKRDGLFEIMAPKCVST